MESELQELRDLIEAQSKQIQTQSEALKEQQQQMLTLENQLKVVSPANASISAAPGERFSASSPAMDPSAIAPNAAVAPNSAAGAQKNPEEDEPPSLRFKGITLTPGGYMAAETVWHRGAGSDINSAFNSVPLPGNSQSHITEFNASGRQSRIACWRRES